MELKAHLIASERVAISNRRSNGFDIGLKDAFECVFDKCEKLFSDWINNNDNNSSTSKISVMLFGLAIHVTI